MEEIPYAPSTVKNDKLPMLNIAYIPLNELLG
jgi:hypothetical protein